MPLIFTAITAYDQFAFTAPLASGHAVTKDIYARGEGPPVVLIQELPGIGPETLRLADRLVAADFRVFLPHLFGPLEEVSTVGNTFRMFCLWREFRIFRRRRSSPVVDWLRALCRAVRQREGAAGVGVIGMCLTGNFAISLMGDDNVLAAVASQPGLPIGSAAGLHLSPEEIAAARNRIDQTAPMLALRFAGDPLVREERFQCLAETFNNDRARIRLRTLPGEGHSVLTLDFVDEAGHPTAEALQEVIDYFIQQLH